MAARNAFHAAKRTAPAQSGGERLVRTGRPGYTKLPRTDHTATVRRQCPDGGTVDTRDLKSLVRKGVRVQIPLRVPSNIKEIPGFVKMTNPGI